MKVFEIIVGILMVILGVYAAQVPFQMFLGIGWILGALLLIHGIEMVIHAFKQKKKSIWQIILGVIVTLGGIILLCNGVQRFLTDITVAYLIGICVIAYGIMDIYTGVKTIKAEKGFSTLKIICGILSVIIGIFAFMHPFMTMFSVGFLIAFSIIFQGIDMILLSFGKGKKHQKEAN